MKKMLWGWLTVPLLALSWVIAWPRLPARVPMKFDDSGRATAWASPGGALEVQFAVLLGTLVFASAIAFVVTALAPEKTAKSAWLVPVVGGFVLLLMNWILWAYLVP